MTLPSGEASLETLAQLLMGQNPLLLQQPSLAGGLPVHLANPLLPQLMQQQMLNNVMQQLISSMLARSSLNALVTVEPPLSEEASPGPATLPEGRELVVPNDDKEGWCRNKKYIEKVANGFMCLVCKKVYGRYNSVSYHVTIYHRNPPIKCDIEGCDFTTREARYIHFHKYYRHGICLPRSIDQGSRRCIYCKHISKSPAMLEKHMKRHVENGPAWMQKMRQSKRDESMCEGGEDALPEEGRPRTFSECPPMEIDLSEPKPRSFTL